MSISHLPTSIDGPVAVIGDVHGQSVELRRIIHQLEHTPDIHSRWIVFVGDLVDRGPDTKGVLDLYCDLSKQHDKVTWICGNHELAMAASLELIQAPDYLDWETSWLRVYSAEPTFESYGVKFGDINKLRSAMPEEHIALLSNLPWRVEHPQYLFVHAGLDPDLPFDMQVQILRQPDYSLGQPPWLFSRTFIWGPVPQGCPVTVVQGHVPLQEVHFGDRIIGTDTTGGVSGDLSCVLLPENIVLTSGNFAPPD
ncbi:MAG: metallophosphoesterase [Fuerstiella sp.]|nr:metallophosphoesterase [Fuerstiella sp.]